MELSRDKIKEIINDDWLLMDDCEGNKNCDVVKELARIALASLEAEPYGYVHKAAYEQAGSCGLSGDHEAYRDSSTHIAVYTATPAPVSVPDERAAFETFMEKRFKDCIDRRLVKNGDGEYFAWDMQVAWIAWQGHAAMLQAEPVSNSDELPLDYLQGHKDGLEWAAQLAEANHPQTGDWLYDDPIDLARAIRKGPDMPTVQGGNSPVIPDGWVMVPVEPTMAMLDEFDSIIDYGAEDSKDAWSRLIAAALQR
ncbi:hypothetical protein ECZU01_05020 [Escherichia coli]|uniref:hypothetical protein n=2 Tax=Escherichia coli TaxID=562 RepID=UPI0011C7230F|nr:hypothetical protein [Escherichia coli]EFN4709059.1 hypothetical protein [Escherichia coli]TXP41852.1 hypothetical protein FV280_21090 [Escherichia coli]GHK06524.1 hypothetical protein ECZU01_05020 [Escherichia coli]HAI2422088.1 hypothetical protein [Escherichia coli]